MYSYLANWRHQVEYVAKDLQPHRQIGICGKYRTLIKWTRQAHERAAMRASKGEAAANTGGRLCFTGCHGRCKDDLSSCILSFASSTTAVPHIQMQDDVKEDDVKAGDVIAAASAAATNHQHNVYNLAPQDTTCRHTYT